jgi:hypothetical protein
MLVMYCIGGVLLHLGLLLTDFCIPVISGNHCIVNIDAMVDTVMSVNSEFPAIRFCIYGQVLKGNL